VWNHELPQKRSGTSIVRCERVTYAWFCRVWTIYVTAVIVNREKKVLFFLKKKKKKKKRKA